MSIKKEIFVTRKSFDTCIDITYGTDIFPIELRIADYVLPGSSIAVAYAIKQDKSGELKKSICEISDNTIILDPKPGFFDLGKNILQIRITASGKELYTYKCEVMCYGNIVSDDAKEIEDNPTLMEQILSTVGEIEEEVRTKQPLGSYVTTDDFDQEKAERISAINAEEAERKREIAVERARIDAIAALPEGANSSDFALEDIKVKFNGETADTPGNAVREQVLYLDKKIDDETSRLSEEIENLTSVALIEDNNTLFDSDRNSFLTNCTVGIGEFPYLAPNNLNNSSTAIIEVKNGFTYNIKFMGAKKCRILSFAESPTEIVLQSSIGSVVYQNEDITDFEIVWKNNNNSKSLAIYLGASLTTPYLSVEIVSNVDKVSKTTDMLCNKVGVETKINDWEIGTYSRADGVKKDAETRIRTVNKILGKAGTRFTIENGFDFSLRFYDESGKYVGFSTPSDINANPWISTDYVLRKDTYYTAIVRKSDDSALTLYCGTHLTVITDNVKQNEFYKILLNGKFDEYYVSSDFAWEQFEGFSHNDIYAKFEELLTTYPNRISKSLLGYGSHTDGTPREDLPIYEYTIVPPLYNNMNAFDIAYDGYGGQILDTPKILISAGVHGSEKASVYSLYQFCKQMLDNYNTSDIMASLHNNCVFKIIPIVNPFGYWINMGQNARNVNINRNFAYHWDVQTTNSNQKGDSSCSELETQIYREWLSNNNNAILHIDFHTTLANLCTYCNTQDVFIEKIFGRLINVFYRKWKEYGYQLDKQYLPFLTYGYNANTTNEALHTYGLKHSCILEFSPYDQSVTDKSLSYTVNIEKVGVELLTNFICAYLRTCKW